MPRPACFKGGWEGAFLSPHPPATIPPSPHETDKLCRVDLHQRFHQLHFSPEAPRWEVVEGESTKIQQSGGDFGGRINQHCPPSCSPGMGQPGGCSSSSSRMWCPSTHSVAWHKLPVAESCSPALPRGLALTLRERSLGTDRTGTLPSGATAPRSRCMGLPHSPRSFQPPPAQPPPHIHSPPNLPVAKVLYLLDVAMVTQA